MKDDLRCAVAILALLAPALRAEEALFPYRADGQYVFDAATVRFREVGTSTVSVAGAACLAAWPDGRLAVAGSDALALLAADGRETARAALREGPATALAVADDRVYLATRQRVQVFDTAARPLATWESLGETSHIAGLATDGQAVWVCDAGQRRVWRHDTEGRLLGLLPGPGTPKPPSFVIPSASFDAVAATNGMFWVVNPGRHQLQLHGADGALRAAWSNAAQTVVGFAGCCNPAAVARLPDGRLVTSEKRVPRVKVYSESGALDALVVPPGVLSGEDARDIATDALGRVYVLDGTRVRVFAENPKP